MTERTHWKKHFSSEHLDASDIPENGTLTVKIESVGTVQLDGDKGQEFKALITFRGSANFERSCAKRTWVAAKTCGYGIAAMFGDYTADWIGKRVTLKSEMVDAFGETVPAVRVAGSPDITKPVAFKVRKGRAKSTIRLVPTVTKTQEQAPPPPQEAGPVERSPDPARAKADAMAAAELAAANGATLEEIAATLEAGGYSASAATDHASRMTEGRS